MLLTTLITSVCGEGGVELPSLRDFRSCLWWLHRSLLVTKGLQRNLVEITELAHLFSVNFCVLVCAFIDEEFFSGLRATIEKHQDATLIRRAPGCTAERLLLCIVCKCPATFKGSGSKPTMSRALRVVLHCSTGRARHRHARSYRAYSQLGLCQGEGNQAKGQGQQNRL